MVSGKFVQLIREPQGSHNRNRATHTLRPLSPTPSRPILYGHDKRGCPAVRAMDKPLNIRQQRFAEFVVSGMTATQAYIRAGYKTTEKEAGANSARLIENDKI